MSLHLSEKSDGKILELHVSEKLGDSDFLRLEQEFARLVKRHGKIRVLVAMRDFHGWDGVALWGEVKFEFKHFADVERLAIVGDQRWEKFLSALCRPFTTAEVRYFDKSVIDQARAWVVDN